MRRNITAIVTLMVFVGQTNAVWAQRSRGSVSAASRGSTTRSATSRGGNVSGSRTVTQTSSGYNINKQIETKSGYSKEVNRDINTETGTVNRSSTATNPWGQSVNRNRTVQNEGGYASVQGSASTSTGRYASGSGVVGRNAYGQPAYSGTVNTKYNGSYATAGARNPYGGWTRATAGPYGGKVTTTLPSGYRTTTYYGRPYYTYGGAYYRPYTYHGVPYYYPVPVPYYAYYSTPPVGAMMIMVAGIAYMVAKDGTYSKQTTSSEGKVVYQSVPPPQGASLKVLPAERVLVTVSGTTYYLSANAFYRRVADKGQDSFVSVTPPAGVVFVSSLPADFEVMQLNTMYFNANGKYYVPYLSAEGKEMYVMVDRPPQPPAQPTAAAKTTAAASGGSEVTPAVRAVAESFRVPAGTLLVVRLASDLSSETAHAGDRFKAFLDRDLAVDGRLVAAAGTRVYGSVVEANSASKMAGTASLSIALTDIQVGDRVMAIKTQPVTVKGSTGKGAKRLVGGAVLGTAIGAIAGGGQGAGIGAAVGAAAGGVAAAAGSTNEAIMAAESPQAFTLGVPFQVEVMTNVAVR